jgi:hypothetical protein
MAMRFALVSLCLFTACSPPEADDEELLDVEVTQAEDGKEDSFLVARPEEPPLERPDPTEPTFTRYASDTIRSPITASVAARMEAVAALSEKNERLFMKVGDSMTVSPSMLRCFAGRTQDRLELDGRDELMPTIDFFRETRIAGTTSFDRESLAAKVGKTAAWAQTGAPSPLAREAAALAPRFAFVGYGTNDMQMGTTYASALPNFAENFSRLLDRLEGSGVIPIVTGLPVRADLPDAKRWVPTYDALTRGLAEARQIPYLSLYRATLPLPSYGLVGDKVHGNSYVLSGKTQACDFTAAGLRFHYNVRNLASLETLDAARRVIVDGEAAPERAALPPVAGAGTAADPFVIDRLPFTHAWDTGRGESLVDRWSCSPSHQGGPEVHYRLSLGADTPIRAIVVDRAETDVDVHLGQADGSCSARGDVLAEKKLTAGEHRVVVDSFLSSTGSRQGNYLLVVVACEAGDPRCR